MTSNPNFLRKDLGTNVLSQAYDPLCIIGFSAFCHASALYVKDLDAFITVSDDDQVHQGFI